MLVHTELRNLVEVITINRPEARNAINYDTSKALADAFDAAEADPAMTGDPVDAVTAQRLGLVNRVVPGAQVLDAAVELAERICRNAPLATRLSKKIVKLSIDVSEDEAFDVQGDVLAEVFTSSDAMEGPRAFVEKREPNWASA